MSDPNMLLDNCN